MQKTLYVVNVILRLHVIMNIYFRYLSTSTLSYPPPPPATVYYVTLT